MTKTHIKNESRQICFSCPFDLFEWLQAKGEAERRNLSNAVIHAIETAKKAETKGA
jgi:hypothetical protein